MEVFYIYCFGIQSVVLDTLHQHFLNLNRVGNRFGFPYALSTVLKFVKTQKVMFTITFDRKMSDKIR